MHLPINRVEKFLREVLTDTYSYIINNMHISEERKCASNEDHHRYDTRHKQNVYLRKLKHEFYKRSPMYLGGKLVNALHNTLKDARSLRAVKNL